MLNRKSIRFDFCEHIHTHIYASATDSIPSARRDCIGKNDVCELMDPLKWKDLGVGLLVWVFSEVHFWTEASASFMIKSWQPINNSFFVHLHFFPSISDFQFIFLLFALFCFASFRFVSFRLLLCAFVYCLYSFYFNFSCMRARTNTCTFGVSKCANAFDFNRLNSTLNTADTSDNKTTAKKAKLFASTSWFVIQNSFVVIAVAVAVAVAAFVVLPRPSSQISPMYFEKVILQETEFSTAVSIAPW